jgi:hypothetical protein
MTELSANIRLRPTRIGFLVDPLDMDSVRKIMRINACLWGGAYNPIIPVFHITPRSWQRDKHEQITGYDFAKGYIRFFEPDVYVEAERGLLEKCGLASLRNERGFDNLVVDLDQFMSTEYQSTNQPSYGQCIFDVLKNVYKNERRFELRDKHHAIISSKDDVFAEACIGVYPDGNESSYLKKAFRDVYKPKAVQSTPETWLKIYAKNFVTPLRVTSHNLEKERLWHHEPIIYIFDPTKSVDIIDLWNLRIEPSPVIPVPINWLGEVSDFLKDLIKDNYRPLKGNPNGIMHHATAEVSRSISEQKFQKIISLISKDLPNGSCSFKQWRNPVWRAPFNDFHGPQYGRIKLTSLEHRKYLSVKEDGFRVTSKLEALSPDFAEKYSGSRFRWANIVVPRGSCNNKIATVFPYNTFDRKWPCLAMMGGEVVGITQEGWVFLQKYKDLEQTVCLLKNDEALIQWFDKNGITAELSEPGRIAKQMLNSLGSLWDLKFVGSKEIIQFLDNVTMQKVERRNDVIVTEKYLGEKTFSAKQLNKVLEGLSKKNYIKIELSNYVKKNVIKLGLEVLCNCCGAKNWYSLDIVDYQVRCERCLKNYDFPQGESKQSWKYKIIGPFAMPNFAAGSYASLLTIRTFSQLSLASDRSNNFSTALNLTSPTGEKCEIDFALWTANESRHNEYGNPHLIIGEAKSFAEEAIKEKDLAQLKIAAGMMPNSFLVISVLKENFSDKEKILLKEFVEWARETTNYQPRHWVILLTGTELFTDFISSTWKKKGEPHSKFSDYDNTRTLSAFSDATLEIYLGMPSYHIWRQENFKEPKIIKKRNEAKRHK